VGPGTPSAGPVVRGAVAALRSAGIAADRVHVVVADRREADRVTAALGDDSGGVSVESHDPAYDDGLCFAGLTRAGEQLRLNRTVFDADFVLPIANAGVAGEGASAFDGLFPDFFDRGTIERVRDPHTGDEAEEPEAAEEASTISEADEAGWLVGAACVVRVAPDTAGGATRVIAGLPDNVLREAGPSNNSADLPEAPDPADLVIAVVSGGEEHQTWDAVARAAFVADQAARPGAVIALWTDLVAEPPESIRRLAGNEDPDDVEAELAEDPRADALAALRLLRTIGRGPVLLRSGLDAELVEDLGFSPLADAEAAERLVARFGGCTFLEAAQHVRFRVDAGV
ncbi:MAG: hypothetical protein AAF805_07230, partial [Planctomycetota bacterium]